MPLARCLLAPLGCSASSSPGPASDSSSDSSSLDESDSSSQDDESDSSSSECHAAALFFLLTPPDAVPLASPRLMPGPPPFWPALFLPWSLARTAAEGSAGGGCPGGGKLSNAALRGKEVGEGSEGSQGRLWQPWGRGEGQAGGRWEVEHGSPGEGERVKATHPLRM